jgi:hypothetical protein
VLKTIDVWGAYEQRPGFHRPYRLRLYSGSGGRPVVVVTAEPFTTWLERLGPEVAPALCARHGLDPCDVIWIAEVPGHDPADPDLDPALAEGLTIGASYTLCTFGPTPGTPGRLRFLRCEPVTGAWIEDELLRCALDDGGTDPPPDPGLTARMARLVRGPAGDLLRRLGFLTVPATLDDAAAEARRHPGENGGAS